MSQGRSCGPCDLCCLLPAVDWPEYPDLHRPANTWCRHRVRGKGCGIYEDRPMHCAAYQCLWLMGMMPEGLRPDRIGGIFDAVDSGSLILIADRDRPDPRDLPAVRAFIAAWNRRRRMRLVVYRDGRRVRASRTPGGETPGGPGNRERGAGERGPRT